ncbi:hypothetical protein GCM10023231_26820 [Olivibacter ginsenosidimutans]|uniref:PKD domain-containing protein n=1 Tax=Olivibacter ginsenosidimutans TaxID=1176537 RepID=A0ABP9BPX8_9SPHI
MKTRLFLFFIVSGLLLPWGCKKNEPDLGPLKAEFAADKQEIQAGQKVVFTDKSTGVPSRLYWTFEGGSPDTSILSSPEITYAIPGQYKVTLRINRGSASDEVVKESFINVGYGQLQADFEVEDTLAYAGDEVTFSNLTTGVAESWKWTFTSGSVVLESDEENPVIKFTTPGLYEVKLVASNPEYADTETKTDYLTVMDPKDLRAAFSANHTLIAAGSSVTFANTSIGSAKTVKWEFEGGSPAISEEENPVVSYAESDRYKVKLTVSNAYVTKVIEKEQYVKVLDAEQLVLLLPFDGDINDISESSLQLSVEGSALSYSQQDRFGVSGSTANFGGATGIVIADDEALNFGSGDYSVSVWVRTTLTSKMMVWQESGKNGSGDNQTWLRLGDNTSDRKIRYATEDASGGTIVNSDALVSDGSWHLVTAVRQGVKTYLYVDGELANETSASAVKVVSNANGFKIGFQEGATAFSNYFTGQLDDIVAYKRALSAAEVRDLLNY